MDWSKRAYYLASFSGESHYFRVEIMKRIRKIKIHPYKQLEKCEDEAELRGKYQYMLSVPKNETDVIEYELRKAFRNDFKSRWKKIEPAK